jgi:hypothetical protein
MCITKTFDLHPCAKNSDGTTSFSSSDLPEQYIKPIFNILSNNLNPILKARLADTLWGYKKAKPESYQAASIAIKEYLLAANIGKNAISYYGRALSIAKELGKTNKLIKSTTKAVISFIFKSTDELSGLHIELIRALPLCHIDKNKFAQLCEKTAENNIPKQKYLLARGYFEREKQFTNSDQDKMAIIAKIAETFLSEAESNESDMVKVDLLKQAALCYQQLDNKNIASQIHKEISSLESKIPNELTQMYVYDFSINRKKIEEEFRDLNIYNTFKKICFSVPMIGRDDLKPEHEYPIISTIGAQFINSEGKVIKEIKPAYKSSDSELNALEYSVFHRLVITYDQHIRSILDYVRGHKSISQKF